MFLVVLVLGFFFVGYFVWICWCLLGCFMDFIKRCYQCCSGTFRWYIYIYINTHIHTYNTNNFRGGGGVILYLNFILGSWSFVLVSQKQSISLLIKSVKLERLILT